LFYVFLPLFLWKVIAILGGTIGACVFIWKMIAAQNKPKRDDKIEFFIMLLHCFTLTCLFTTEILIFFKIFHKLKFLWLFTIVPLLLASPCLILSCIWLFYRQRVVEFEPFIVIISVQALFIMLKLDKIIISPWLIVMIPIWVVMLLIVVCFFIVLCHISVNYVRNLSSNQEDTLQYLKPAHILSSFLLVLIPMMLFLIMLVIKLDAKEPSLLSWGVIFSPFTISIMLLLLLQSFGTNNSRWWFGIEQDYFNFVLAKFPILRQLCNNSFYIRPAGVPDDDVESVDKPETKRLLRRFFPNKRQTEKSETLPPMYNFLEPD